LQRVYDRIEIEDAVDRVGIDQTQRGNIRQRRGAPSMPWIPPRPAWSTRAD
jgi:hypothetical protein